MKITLIHGDYVAQSRQRFNQIIDAVAERGWQIVRIDPRGKLSFSEQLSADSLFPEETLYICENLGNLSSKDLAWLSKNADNLKTNLLFWHGSLLGVRLTKSLPNGTKIEKFELPKLIFKFLESLYPGNSREALKLLHLSIKTEPQEFIFALIARQFRDLFWVATDSKTFSGPSWRIGKLKSQAKKFSDNQLKLIINELAEIDIKSKTSQTDLITSLDFLIASQLK